MTCYPVVLELHAEQHNKPQVRAECAARAVHHSEQNVYSSTIPFYALVLKGEIKSTEMKYFSLKVNSSRNHKPLSNAFASKIVVGE